MEHEELIEKAKAAITDVFSDKSVNARQTYDDLNELQGEIDIMIDTLGIVDL